MILAVNWGSVAIWFVSCFVLVAILVVAAVYALALWMERTGR